MAKFCTECGAAMENDRAFCPDCGKAVEGGSNPFKEPARNSNFEEPMGLGDWIITLLITYIPVVGFIMTIVWALTASNTSKKNYARATLLFMIIGFVFVVLMSGCAAAMAFEHGMYI